MDACPGLREEDGKLLFNGFGVFFGGGKNVWALDRGDGCTTV